MIDKQIKGFCTESSRSFLKKNSRKPILSLYSKLAGDDNNLLDLMISKLLLFVKVKVFLQSFPSGHSPYPMASVNSPPDGGFPAPAHLHQLEPAFNPGDQLRFNHLSEPGNGQVDPGKHVGGDGYHQLQQDSSYPQVASLQHTHTPFLIHRMWSGFRRVRVVFHLNLFLSTLIGGGRTANATGEDDGNDGNAMMVTIFMTMQWRNSSSSSSTGEERTSQADGGEDENNVVIMFVDMLTLATMIIGCFWWWRQQ